MAIVHGIEPKWVSYWEQSIPKVSKKCHLLNVNVYCTDQIIMQKGTLWNWILKVLKYKNEIYQRIELICLVRWLHVKLWLLKCQKLLIFCIFSWWLQNCHNLVKSPPERSSWFVLENTMVIRLWSYRSWKIKGKNIKKSAESARTSKILNFQGLTFC